MIIIHENMPDEAEHISSKLKEVYGFSNSLFNINLDDSFLPVRSFPGFYSSSVNLINKFSREFKNKKVFVLTPRDLYGANNDQNDDWIFGYKIDNLTVVASARLKREDSQPSLNIQVPIETYLRRLDFLAIHEVGHDVVKAQHHKEAIWVNARTGYRMELGPHCTDNRCVMYEIVEIKSPQASEGYMLLGDEKKYDAGLNDVLNRLYSEWFCSRCRAGIRIDPNFLS